MQKQCGSSETQRLLLSRLNKKKNDQVFFYIVMFYIFSLFQMIMFMVTPDWCCDCQLASGH